MSNISYIGVAMAFEEKRTWIVLVTALGGAVAYLVLLLNSSGPIEDSYVPMMLGTLIATIVVTIVLNIVVGSMSPKSETRTDQRDDEIGQFSEYTGQSLLVIGAIAALGLALADIDQFWIANTIYLAFLLSSVLSCTVRILSYRFGIERW